jgi:lipoyl-dependent peroxiredoxin
MPVRSAEAEWIGGLTQGHGNISLESGAFEGAYSFGTRFEDAKGTNPEELIGAAHAGCFSMALSAELGKAGHTVNRVHTSAKVHLEKAGEGFAITRIHLSTRADVRSISADEFQTIAEQAKIGCPVSKALAGVVIELDATLEESA